MNINRYFTVCFSGLALLASCNSSTPKKLISFYETHLVCHADTTIACATRVKPFFIETTKLNAIEEVKINRGGTALAIFWRPGIKSIVSADDSITPIFTDNRITAKLITDSTRIKDLLKGLDEKGKWYSRKEIDQLSLDEANAITKRGIAIAKAQGLLNTGEEDSLKVAVKNFYDSELLNIKTYHELVDSEIRSKADSQLSKIVSKYVEQKQARIILEIFNQLTFHRSKLPDTTIDKCCTEPERP